MDEEDRMALNKSCWEFCYKGKQKNGEVPGEESKDKREVLFDDGENMQVWILMGMAPLKGKGR